MRLRTYLASIAKVLRTHNPQRPWSLPCRLELQQLDDRVVPSILFSSTGSRSIVDTGGPILNHMQVDLIFWGSHWNDIGPNQILRNEIRNSVNAILNSPYFDGLTQYRSIGHGTLLRSDTITTTNPPASFTTAFGGDVSTFVANNINNNTLPGPNGQILYFVVPQPGSNASDCGCFARHLAGIASGNRVFPYGLTSNPTGVSIDKLSVAIAHEMVEAATNPEWNITVGGVSQAAFHVPGSNGDEIGDGEPDGKYVYRVHDAFAPQNTALVQAYLSQRDHAYILTNGSTHNFRVSSGGLLTFEESSGGYNTIGINNINGGVYAELNSSTAQFEPGVPLPGALAITGVQVDSVASGSNQISIYGNPVPVTVIGSGTAGVFIGAAGRVSNVWSTVTVNTTPGRVALYVDDSADPNFARVTLDRTHISFGGPSISYGVTALSSLTLNGGTGGGSYTIADTPSAPTTVRTRGNNTVLVWGNSSQLNIDGQASSDYVEIGKDGRVGNILASVSVTNTRANGTALVVSNSSDSGNRAVSLSSTQISFGGPALTYGVNALGGLQLLGGTGVNTYTITSTPNTAGHDVLLQTEGNGDLVRVLANTSPVYINGGAPNRVEVGNNGRLTNISRDVTVVNPRGTTDLVSDDSTDPGSPTATITGSTVSYGNPNAVLRYSNLSSLAVKGGPGGATFNVLGTAANAATTVSGPTTSASFTTNVKATTGPLVISTHGLFDMISVGDAANSLDRIQGAVTVDVQVAFAMQIDDSATTVAHVYDLTTASLNRDGAPVLNFAPGYRGGFLLTAGRGVGGNTFNVLGVPPTGGSFQTNDGDVANVGSPDGTLSGLGTVSILGGAAIALNDQGETAAQTYTFGRIIYNTIMTTGTTVQYNGAASVTLYGGSGGNTVNVQSVPAATVLALDAGGGTNTLDYTGYAGNVLVNLQTGTATGFAGGIANIQNVTGASGGPAGSYNILVGNGGNVLTGGTGRRNLLVAGPTASTLIGGNGDDILIGGTTAYDQEADMVSLRAIMDYWAGTADDYATRVANLLAGNGVPLLDATMVTNNGGGNTLLGHGGGAGELNLYYGLDPSQENTDYDPNLGEQFINV